VGDKLKQATEEQSEESSKKNLSGDFRKDPNSARSASKGTWHLQPRGTHRTDRGQSPGGEKSSGASGASGGLTGPAVNLLRLPFKWSAGNRLEQPLDP